MAVDNHTRTKPIARPSLQAQTAVPTAMLKPDGSAEPEESAAPSASANPADRSELMDDDPATAERAMAGSPSNPEDSDEHTRTRELRHRRPSAAPRDLGPGQVIHHYELIRPLGRGGMGQVFLARDTRLARLVALKFLAEKSRGRAARFVAEARATAQFSHDSVVGIHDINHHGGRPYMVLEYVSGQTLEDWLASRGHLHHSQQRGDARSADAGRAISPRRAVELMIPVVRALVRAHDLGIVHRDLKPSNIMLTDAGAVKVLDFGIAKLLSAPDKGAPMQPAPDVLPQGSPTLTQPGIIIGTMAYMSPEQWRAGEVDGRADIWAVGILLYELVTGRHPLAPLSRDALKTVADLDLPMPSVREVRSDLGGLASIIDRCLIKRVEDRIGSAAELLSALEDLPLGERPAAFSGCPYTGLAAFQEGDADRYFGREHAVAEVLRRLDAQALITVVGPSGAGKSSFVRAGVLPALRKTDETWEAYIIRPGPHPLSALADLLAARIGGVSQLGRTPSRSARETPGDFASSPSRTGDDAMDSERDRAALCQTLTEEPGLAGAILRARARRKLARIALVIDQFEELYTLATAEERGAFLRCLGGIADDAGSPLRVILTMRSDFLDRVAEADAAATGLSRGLMLLTPMDRHGLAEALTRPLEAVDYRFESQALVDDIVKAIEHIRGALPLLQFTAAKLWETRDRTERLITAAGYRALGGVAGALATHADEVVAAMSPQDRRLARAILLRLITPERTRALVSTAELAELSSAAPDMHRVLGRLVEARLVTVEGGDSTGMVEIVHESLIDSWPTLSQWLSDNEHDAAFLSRLRSAAQQWQASDCAEGLLWRGQAAEDARRLYQRLGDRVGTELAPSEARYLREVLALADRGKRQRRRGVMLGLTATLAVALAMAYLAWEEAQASRAASDQAERAGAAALAAQKAAESAQIEARRARDATRMATAREQKDDPTTVIALLREVESPESARGWVDLAAGALQAQIARVVLSGHEGPVRSVAFRPGLGGNEARPGDNPADRAGTRLVTASWDGTARIWNADGSGEPTVLRGHNNKLWAAAFSPDGTRVVTASSDKTARIWNADGSGQPTILSGHDDAVYSAAFSHDGKRVATTSQDGTARVWNADGTGAPIILRGHEGAVYWAAFSPDGTRVITASWDNTARIWNADGSGKPLILRGHASQVYGAAFSPDGRRVVTGSWDTTARVWNADGTGEPTVLRGHMGVINMVVFTPDGRRVVTASQDRTARIWNADGTGMPLVLGSHGGEVTSVAVSADGAHIATASADSTVRIWDGSGCCQPIVLGGHKARTYAATFSPDGTRVATASQDQTARIFPADGAGTPLVLHHVKEVNSVDFSPDGTRLVTSSSDHLARIWNADGSGQPIILRGHHGPVYLAMFRPDGKAVATASADATVRIWSADGKGEPMILRGHRQIVYSAMFSPDSTRLVSASGDLTARIWNADGTGEPLVFRGHTGEVNSASFSPDGRRIVTTSQDQTARIWNADGSGEPIILRGHEAAVVSAMFSPDGTRVITASMDQTARVWNADGSGQPLVLRGHAGSVYWAAFARDGTRVVTASDDTTARIWRRLDNVLPGDALLWRETGYCMPAPVRQSLLGMDPESAAGDAARCRERAQAALHQGP